MAVIGIMIKDKGRKEMYLFLGPT